MTERAMTERAVLVVGAGPVGLTSALALRSFGVDVAVLEAEAADRLRPGSRAIYVHRASLLLLERIRAGLGWELAKLGVVWPAKRTLWRGREVFSRTYPPPPGDRLPPFTSLPQTEVEGVLLDECVRSGVEIAWDTPVHRLAPGPRGVQVEASDGARWAAGYVIGADGARSTARREIGVPMEGSRSENHYVVVDVDEDPDRPRPAERVFHYEHPDLGGRNLLLVPFAGGWRADLQCQPEDDPERFERGDGLHDWIARGVGDRYAERIRWVSTYRFLQVVARRLVDASTRVLLVGDAAHLFAPFGARGLNSGIADAHAAAAAVQEALRAPGADASREAVERFAVQRREAAVRNRRAAGLALEAIQSRRPWPRAKRRIAAALAPIVPRAGTWLDSAPYGPRLPDPERRWGY